MEGVPVWRFDACIRVLFSIVLLLSTLCCDICNGQTNPKPIILGASTQVRLINRPSTRRSESEINASPRTIVQPASSAAVRALTSKSWALGFCSFPIVFRGKRLNRNNFRMSSSDAGYMATLLNGANLQDNVYIWCRIAHFNDLAEQERGRRIGEQNVEQLNNFEGDMIFSLENVDEVFSDTQSSFLRSNARIIPQLSIPRSFQRNNPSVTRLTNRLNPRRGSNLFGTNPRRKRKVSSVDDLLWENEQVDYVLDNSLSAAAREAVRLGILQWEQWTCLTFNQLFSIPVGSPHLVFDASNGCSALVGKQSAGQSVSIGSGCEWAGIAAHEIGHALGFFHEQSRPDRDDYVTVNLENVQAGLAGNFRKRPWTLLRTFGVPYDYGSVMHYSPKEFAIGAMRTIEPANPLIDSTLGQREGLSFADIKLANINYCRKLCGDTTLDWSACKQGGYRNPKTCTDCICPKGFSPPFCETLEQGRNANCGEQELRATTEYQTLESDGYNTGGYSKGAFCVWRISAKGGESVVFEFQDEFQFDDGFQGLTCDLSYVEVRRDPQKPGRRFCNKGRPSEIMKSSGTDMLVIMVAGEKDPLRGFRARFKLESCGGCSESSRRSEPACNKFTHTQREFNANQACFGPSCERRKNVKFTEELFCCTGYVLRGNSCVGNRPTTASTTSTQTTTRTTRRTTTPTTRRTTTPTTRRTTTPTTRRTTTPTTRRTTTPTTRRTTTPTTRRTTRTTRRTTTPTTRRTTTPTTRRTTTPTTIRTTPSSIGPVTPDANGFGPWGPWTPCSVSCGYCGFRTRSRLCLRQPCIGRPWEVQRCPVNPCPYYPFVAAQCYWANNGEIWCLPQGSFCFHKLETNAPLRSAGKDGNTPTTDTSGNQIVGTIDVSTGITKPLGNNNNNNNGIPTVRPGPRPRPRPSVFGSGTRNPGK